MTEHRTASAPDAPVEEAAVGRALEHGRPAPHQVLRAVTGTRDLPTRARALDDTVPPVPPRTRDPQHVLTALVGRGQRHVLVEDTALLDSAGEQPDVRLTLVPAARP